MLNTKQVRVGQLVVWADDYGFGETEAPYPENELPALNRNGWQHQGAEKSMILIAMQYSYTFPVQ